MKKRVLITGGCGFVGRHLVHLLAREPDVELWIVDNLSTGKHPDDWEVPKLTERSDTQSVGNGILHYDVGNTGNSAKVILADFAAVAQAELGIVPNLGLDKLPPFDEVYHLASVVGGRNVIDNDPLAVGIDLSIDAVFFLWAAKVARPQRILYASSSAAYPIDLQTEGKGIPLKEEFISFGGRLGLPDYTYGWSKLTGEYLSRIAVEKYGLSVGIVRPFSGYGEDQDPVYPFPAIALRVAAHQNPVKVWGSGLQGRDFVHIDDACEVCVLVCRGVHDASAVNIGSGLLTTFRELAARMVELEGYKAEVTGLPGKPVGVAERYCDTSLLWSRFQWKPRISLDQGIRRSLDYAKLRLERGIPPE